ncbi:MurR/RpiR family transcriptional regulator [Deltaproteobacteria bacterium OttesenSCG-928-M10]|nr:MurR/RpiR family transcriptional regulator [Deltaproteobacteria bacterium OttesenSCG-928-M10]
MTSKVSDKIKENAESYSPKLVLLAKYIEAHYQEIAFMSSNVLARGAGVSESTVTRLAYACGYSGWASMQEALQGEIHQKLSWRRYVSPSKNKGVLAEVGNLEKNIIDDMVEQISPEQLDRVVKCLHQAEEVVTVSTVANTILGSNAAFFLGMFKKNVRQVTCLGSQSFNASRTAGKTTAALVYSFPRYPKETQGITAALKESGARIIGITDSTMSPLSRYADELLVVPIKFVSYVDPYAAVLVLTQALVMGVFNCDKKKYGKELAKYNKHLVDNDVMTEPDLDITSLI